MDKPGSPQTVLLAFGLGVPRSTPDYPSIQIMNDVLGGLFSSRLNMNLRETHGYTYGAISRFSFDRFGGPMFAGAQVRTDVTAPAAEGVVRRAGPHHQRSANRRRAETGAGLTDSFRALASSRRRKVLPRRASDSSFVFNLPNDYYAALPAQLAAVKPQQVTQAAIDHIHPKQMIVVAVGDRTKIEPGLKELNLGPIEYRDASGDPVK